MSAESETEIPSYHEVEEILADDKIDFDTRRALALEYLDYVEEEDVTEYGFRDEAHFQEFREKYMSSETLKISDGDIAWNDAGESYIEDTYAKAKEAFDRNRDADRQGSRDAVNKGSSDLEAIKGKTSSTEPGAENSNAILDTGAPSLKCFEIFIPRYNRALGLAGGGGGMDTAEIRRFYDEQRDIPFGKFKAGAAEFSTVKDAVSKSSTDVSGGLKPTLSAWEGSAADQARAYQSGYEKQTAVVEGAFGDAAQAMLEAVATVSQHCQGKADWVQRYYFDRIFDKVTAEDLDRMMRIVELGKYASQNDFVHCARLIGGEAEAAVNDESCDLNDETIRIVQEEARQWLADPFCAWFGKHVENFKLMCENTRTAVDGTWSALATLLNELPEDPYAAKPDAKPDQASENGRGVRGGGTPGGGMPGGAGTAPAGMGMPKPDAGAMPGTNPVTGKPLELDPETGESYPIDPETGEAVEDVGADQDAMTVKQGEHEISLSEPDPDGKMGISISDGKGHPKEYDLDFGDADGPGPTDFGPQRAPDLDGEKVYRPGPDGKISIEDGELTITAERPAGPDGPTVVTVDDGNGEPTSYTIGESDSAASDSPATPPPESKPASTGEVFAQEIGDKGSGGATTPQFFGGAADAVGSSLGGGDGSFPANIGASTGGVGLGDTSSLDAGQQVGSSQPGSSAGLASIAGPSHGPVPGDASAAAPGGAPMGGMMGGMGAGGGGGVAEQSHSRNYNIDGGLFDTEESVVSGVAERISGFLGDDE